MTVRDTNKFSNDDLVTYAVVVGLCAHGLSIVRDLHSAGINVIALESDTRLPGAFTRYATVKFVDDINDRGLIDALVSLAEVSDFGIKPVLFLTNDRMVETVGNDISLIERFYNLSWAKSSVSLVPLLDKRNIEARCCEKGLNYPRSVLISDGNCLRGEISRLSFPVILKPTRPLSKFKTLVLDSLDHLSECMSVINSSLPVLAQEYIPGDDSTICFGALVLRDGEVFARFEGRKLRSRPMGHTTVAVSEENEEVFRLAKTFFSGLNICGPVSLELKKNLDGSYWVIEPTVGRTDFWVGLCSANGVNFPLAEFKMACDLTAPTFQQSRTSVWVNEERDPGAVLWLLFNYPKCFFNYRIRFVFVGLMDFRPAVVFVLRYLKSTFFRALAKGKRLLFGK